MKLFLTLLLLIPSLSWGQILACKNKIETEKFGIDYFELDGDNLVLISTNMKGLTLELSYKDSLSNDYSYYNEASDSEYKASLNKHDLEMIFDSKNTFWEYESRIIYDCELSISLID